MVLSGLAGIGTALVSFTTSAHGDGDMARSLKIYANSEDESVPGNPLLLPAIERTGRHYDEKAKVMDGLIAGAFFFGLLNLIALILLEIVRTRVSNQPAEATEAVACPPRIT